MVTRLDKEAMVALKRIPVPNRVSIPEDGRRMTVTWSDGLSTDHEAFALRGACPCAGCVDEMTGVRTLDPNRVDPEIGLRNWQMVGRYALQFTFSDGHDTGIFTFESLRQE